MLAVWTLRTTPALTWVSVLLGIPVVILTMWEALDPANQPILLWSSVLHAAFYFYITYGLIRYMFNDRFVTPRRAVRHRSDLHGRGVGVRLPVHGVPGRVAGVVHRGNRP